jgi:outer membrane protein insertion porin family
MRKALTLLALVLLAASPAVAQTPAAQPPERSAPVVRTIQLAFPTQGDVSVIEAQTYLYYIQTRPSRPSEGAWVPFNEQTVLDDFKRLWATNFLDDLSIDVKDVPYPNGVVGKHITYNMEERQRVKVVDYVGTKQLEQTKIEERLKERNLQIRYDSFIDPGLVRKVSGVVREMLAEKGYQFGEVTHEIKPVAGGPKLVHLTFNISEGPKVRIRAIDFIGNKAISDGTLKKRMKENKEQWFLSFISGRGTYQEAKFEEDADKIVEYYRDRGYVTARVGQPELKFLEDSPDKTTRWVQLGIPVAEGERYRVGNFDFDGNTVINTDLLRPLFKNKTGDFYSEKDIRQGLEKARELYGSGGYFEFTAYPDLRPRAEGSAANNGAAINGTADGQTEPSARGADRAPIVDVTMRVQQGKQYFVNRITFVGNTTTRDNVIRREIRLLEGHVFNTEALKFSVKRLNQLGYFKNLEGDAINVEKTPGADPKVDVTLKLEEQNRNQLTFGAGVSQFEGFFGQLSFQTANFMGRGETLTAAIQAGSRAHNYQIAFTEPFMFDRPITGGFDVFNREVRYESQYTQSSQGGNVVFGFPVADFSRMFVNYSYEQVRVTELNELFFDSTCLFSPEGCGEVDLNELTEEQLEALQRNPFLYDSLLIGQGGRRTISKIAPSFVHNTIDNPIFPTSGRRFTAGMEFAGLGGNTNYLKPRAEGVWFVPHTRLTSFGVRGMIEYIRPVGSTRTLPIFERLFQGGEYTVRGYDIRSIGPSDPVTGLVIGGNKSLLFNAEYLISVGGPVRLVLFYDAGQVRDVGDSFVRDEFKTSTGAEVRFFMPVLNVPFRLIFAYNPNREGVRDNNLEPAKEFAFRFAVGTTF